jgi:hypothetical protein
MSGIDFPEAILCGFIQLLENPGIPLPFRIQTVSLEVLNIEFNVLDEIN